MQCRIICILGPTLVDQAPKRWCWTYQASGDAILTEALRHIHSRLHNQYRTWIVVHVVANGVQDRL